MTRAEALAKASFLLTVADCHRYSSPVRSSQRSRSSSGSEKMTRNFAATQYAGFHSQAVRPESIPNARLNDLARKKIQARQTRWKTAIRRIQTPRRPLFFA